MRRKVGKGEGKKKNGEKENRVEERGRGKVEIKKME